MQKKATASELSTTSNSCDVVSENAEEKTFQGGFFKITSPVRSCPSPVAEPETGKKATEFNFSFK